MGIYYWITYITAYPIAVISNVDTKFYFDREDSAYTNMMKAKALLEAIDRGYIVRVNSLDSRKRYAPPGAWSLQEPFYPFRVSMLPKHQISSVSFCLN